MNIMYTRCILITIVDNVIIIIIIDNLTNISEGNRHNLQSKFYNIV